MRIALGPGIDRLGHESFMDMNNPILFKFVEEIRLQCGLVRIANENMRASVQGLNAERTFFYVHALLNHVAAVSRLLWPERESSLARGERLRGELKVGEQSALKMRDLRRHIDRADESFEDWLAGLETVDYLDFNIMPQGTMQGYKQDRFQRNLDPDTFRLEFRGARCDLRELFSELLRLEAAAQVWLKTHNPW